MRTRTKVTIAASVAILLAGVAVAGATYADGRGWGHHGGQNWGRHGGQHGGPHGGQQGGHHGGRHMMRMFESFDGNADGKLTQAEIDAARATQLARFDADGDGALKLSEYQALWLDAMRERMVDRFQSLDADGDAAVTAAEFAEPFAGAVRFMDRDGDGAIGRDDMGRHRRYKDDDDDDDD